MSGAEAMATASSSTNRAVIEAAAPGVGALSTVVVYVHGLWQSGAESLLLRRRLARSCNAETMHFRYPSVTADAADNARGLGDIR